MSISSLSIGASTHHPRKSPKSRLRACQTLPWRGHDHYAEDQRSKFTYSVINSNDRRADGEDLIEDVVHHDLSHGNVRSLSNRLKMEHFVWTAAPSSLRLVLWKTTTTITITYSDFVLVGLGDLEIHLSEEVIDERKSIRMRGKDQTWNGRDHGLKLFYIIFICSHLICTMSSFDGSQNYSDRET